MMYLPCELHCHTLHSDGAFTVRELQCAAKKAGLSLIALTDHNTLSGHSELDGGIIPAVRGIEWTTYFGHMLVLGAEKFVDWRDAVPDNIDTKMKQVRECGGLVGIAHPFQLGSPMCTGGRWEFKVRDYNNVDYVEIWHGRFSEDNYENDRAAQFWTLLLDKGYKIAAAYGRDWHREEKGVYGVTYLGFDGTATPENALTAIKNGRTVVSKGAEFYFIVEQDGNFFDIGDTVSAGEAKFIFTLKDDKNECERINIVSNSGKTVLTLAADEKEAVLTLEKGKWYRAELTDGKNEVIAMTSPIYTGRD